MKPMEILHDDVHEYWTPDCSEPKLILEPRKIPEEGFWDRGSDLLEVMKELKMSIQYDIQFKGWKLADVTETVFYCTMVHGLIKGGFGLQLESRDMADWGDDWLTDADVRYDIELLHYRGGVLKFILDHVCKHGNGKSLRQQQESMKRMLGFNMARKVTVTFYTRDTVPGGRMGLTTSTVGKRVRTRSELAAER